jgi:uncharacterized protein YkwD
MKNILTILILVSTQIFGQPYPEPTANIPWAGAAATVADIQSAFQNARTAENVQAISAAISTVLNMPAQGVWDAMSPSEKGLYLTNAERVARGLLPLEGVHAKVVAVAQAHADDLRANNAFEHTFNGKSPSDRLNDDAAINGCSEQGYQWGPENLYAAANSAPSTFPLSVEQAVYGWIYNDAGSAWGHRNACFAPFNNNHGTAGSEGFVGFGVSAGDYTYFGASFPFGVVVVYNFVDPCPASALPVELTAFSAQLVNNKNILLNWETATEVNNYGFEVERQYQESSSNNKDWEKISFIAGHGNSNSTKYYSFTDNSIQTSGKYSYRLKQVDIDGTFEYSDAIEAELGLPQNYVLEQNYPNPFNPTTSLSYSIPSDGNVTFTIFDVLGNEVSKLENGYKSAGTYSYNFDASELSSGMYFYTIRSGKFVQTKKMLLMK